MQLEFGAWICRKHRLCLTLLPWNTLYMDTTVVRGASLQGSFVFVWCSGNVWHVILKQKENNLSIMLHLLFLSIRGSLKESGEEARQEASNMLLIMLSHETRSNAIKMNLPIQVFFVPQNHFHFLSLPISCLLIHDSCLRASSTAWSPVYCCQRSLISTSRWAKGTHESGLWRDSYAYCTAKRDFLSVFLLFSSKNIWTFLNQDTPQNENSVIMYSPSPMCENEAFFKTITNMCQRGKKNLVFYLK